MPEIDLPPERFRERDPKTGRLFKPTSRRFGMWWFLIAVAVLVAVFFVRDELPSGALFGLTAIFGVSAGVMLQVWLGHLR